MFSFFHLKDEFNFNINSMETIQKQFKINSNLFNFLKTGVLVLLILSVLVGCEKDLNEDNLNTHFSLIKTKIITGNEKDIVTNKLKTLLENKLDKQNKLTIQTNRTTLDVVEYTDVIAITGENGAVNYTFRVEDSGIVAHKFYNLILEERNEYSTVILAEYTMTADFATDYFLETKDFSEFQGSIAYTQIMNNNPCPPINYPITVGTGGGGAVTGGGSGISYAGGFAGGSGGSGTVTVSCNNCNRHFSSIRDFNNTPACRVFTYTIYVSLRIAPIPSLPVTNPCPEDTLPIAVAPADRTTIRINNLLGNILLPNQLSLLTSNSTEADKILTFLLENKTAEGKEFIIWSINYLLTTQNATFDSFLNNRTDFDVTSGDYDNNTDGGFDNTVYEFFNPTQSSWPSIPSVIPVNKFVGWNRQAHPTWECMHYSKEQLRVMGYQISNYFNNLEQTIQIYTEQNGVNLTESLKGISYLKYALENDIPVIVGVDNHSGSPNKNTDNTTDHFIVIVGMGTDTTGKYFQFYDNASGNTSQGASPLNKLYYNSRIGIISGTSQANPYAVGLIYTITMIRKSKLL